RPCFCFSLRFCFGVRFGSLLCFSPCLGKCFCFGFRFLFRVSFHLAVRSYRCARGHGLGRHIRFCFRLGFGPCICVRFGFLLSVGASLCQGLGFCFRFLFSVRLCLAVRGHSRC